MTRLQSDATLELPAPPPTPTRIASPDALARAATARSGPIVLSGLRTRVEVDPRGGIRSVHGDERAATGAWELEGWSAATIVRSPRILRRELTGPGGTLLETTLLPERLPGIVVQYERIAGPPTATARLRVRLLPDAAGVRVHVSDGRCVAEADGTRVSLLLAGAAGAAARVDGNDVALDFELGVDGPVTALLMVDPAAPSARGASLAALGAVEAHRRRAELDALGEDHGGLRVDTGIVDIDEGVAWVRARLRDRRSLPPGDSTGRPHAPAEDAEATGWLVRGALASGDHDAARAFLLSMPPSPDALLAWSRWIGWTGDHHLLLDHRDVIESALGTLVEVPRFTAERLRKTVADAVEAAGEEEWASLLRADADLSTGPERGDAPRKVSLPVVGRSSAAPAAPDDVLRAARMGLPLPAGPLDEVRVDGAGMPGSDAMAGYTLDRSDEAYASLRPELSRWAHDPPGEDVSGACALTALVEGMLGIRPDAAFGRIRIAPAFPAAWTGAAFEGITVERIRIAMRWSREGDRHVFLFLPQAGSVPGMLIFEPRLPGHAIREVRIDGRVAEVAVDRLGDRVMMQVQLPADGERRIEIDVET